MRECGPLMDHREAIDICRGSIFEGEAGKAFAGRRSDDPQRRPDILGRLELAIAPGEVTIRLKAFRVLAENGAVEIGIRGSSWGHPGTRRTLAKRAKLRRRQPLGRPLIGSSFGYSPAKVGPSIHPI